MKQTRRVLSTAGLMAVGLAALWLSGCAMIKASQLAGEGSRLVEEGDPQAAVEKFKESIALNDNDAAHAGLAEAYLSLGRYSEAEQEAKKAIELSAGSLDKNTDRYHLILARAYLLQANGRDAFDEADRVVKTHYANVLADPISRRLVKEGLLLKVRVIEATGSPDQAAEQVNQEGIQLKFPNDLDFEAERAVIAALQHKSDEALRIADAVLEKKPDEGDALLAKGIVYATTGKVEEAKAILEKPLREDPTRILVLLQSTRELRVKQKNDQAVELLKLLEEIQPQNHLVHRELAFAYLDLKQYDASIEEHELLLKTYPSLIPYTSQTSLDAYKKALEANPPSEFDAKELAGYYENLGALYMQKGNLDKAIESLERAAAAKASPRIYQALAGAYDRKEMYDKAIATLEKSLELDPGNPEILKAMGAIYFKAGKPDQATEALKRSLEGHQDDPEAHLNLGVVFFNSGHYDSAIEQFEIVTKLDPDNADAFYYLAVAQYKAGKKKEAEKNFEKVIQLDETYADAYTYLGNLAVERKAYAKAKEYFRLEDKYKGRLQDK